jgi:hypothetical protein
MTLLNSIWAYGTKVQLGAEQVKKQYRPKLEVLEDRNVPSSMVWQPSNGDRWDAGPGIGNGAYNFWNNSTGLRATRVPNMTDDVSFSPISRSDCIIPNGFTAACNSLYGSFNYTGILEINGVLNVYGTGSSSWLGSGQISTNTSAGILNIIGRFEYDSVDINMFVAQPPALNVYLSYGGSMFFGGNFMNLGANLHIGRNSNGGIAGGTVTFDQLNNIVSAQHSASIEVTSNGILNIGPGVDVINLGGFTSEGQINLDDGCQLAMNIAVDMYINGGYVRADDTGTMTITAPNVYINNTTITCGLGIDYSTLHFISASVVITNSIISIDVNSSINGQCDLISCDGDITVDSSDELKIYTCGANVNQNFSYQVITVAEEINGNFGNFTWGGSNPTPLNGGTSPWNTSNDVTDYTLYS